MTANWLKNRGSAFAVVEHFPDLDDRWYYLGRITHHGVGVTAENLYRDLVVGPHLTVGKTTVWVGLGERKLLAVSFTFT